MKYVISCLVYTIMSARTTQSTTNAVRASQHVHQLLLVTSVSQLAATVREGQSLIPSPTRQAVFLMLNVVVIFKTSFMHLGPMYQFQLVRLACVHMDILLLAKSKKNVTRQYQSACGQVGAVGDHASVLVELTESNGVSDPLLFLLFMAQLSDVRAYRRNHVVVEHRSAPFAMMKKE